jgi:hypothetical protein
MRSPFLLVSRMTRWPSGSAVDASGSGDEAVRLMHALGRKWVLVRVSLNEQQVIKIYTTWDRAEDAALRSGVKLYIRWGAARRRLWTGNYSRWRVLLRAKPTRAQRRMELMEQPRRATVTRHQWVSAQIATAACEWGHQPSRCLVMGAAGTNRPDHADRGRMALGKNSDIAVLAEEDGPDGVGIECRGECGLGPALFADTAGPQSLDRSRRIRRWVVPREPPVQPRDPLPFLGVGPGLANPLHHLNLVRRVGGTSY